MAANMETMKKEDKLRFYVDQKQQSDSQMNELLMAKEEVDLLEKDATIYKLVGPLMVPQSIEEVKENMKSRLQFLNKNIEFYEKQIKELHPGVKP